MSRVAAELGVSTMSLYRYVAAKDELLALMSDAASGRRRRCRRARLARAAAHALGVAQRAVLLAPPLDPAHPDRGAPITPNQMAWMERGLASWPARA